MKSGSFALKSGNKFWMDDAFDLSDAVNDNQDGPSDAQSSENEEVTIRERQHESQNEIETGTLRFTLHPAHVVISKWHIE